ncbi:MAG: M15 family metallopeptidase [Oscillospiraceae bacterium]|nr:M15 family metallopeptidase [Oscillospiraceae bacterium]
MKKLIGSLVVIALLLTVGCSSENSELVSVNSDSTGNSDNVGDIESSESHGNLENSDEIICNVCSEETCICVEHNCVDDPCTCTETQTHDPYYWALILVNARNPLPEGYSPDLAYIGSHSGTGDRRYLDARAAPYAIAMLEAAMNDGIILDPVSSYRGLERQTINFKWFFENVMSERGYTPQEAFDYTASWIAPPGTSEHNAAIAIDFNLIDESFDQTNEYRWLIENAHRFGFILRYPKDTEHITGIKYEPWHFRFVGIENAERIRDTGLTLEEYLNHCMEDDTVVEAFRNQVIG